MEHDRKSQIYRSNRNNIINKDFHNYAGFHTGSVMSESTAASTRIQALRVEPSVEEMEENIWCESRQSKRSGSTGGKITETKTWYIGEQAFINYYNKYKQVWADSQRRPDSPSIVYIRECQKLGISPAPIGLVKRKGKESEINIRNYFIGDRRGIALGTSMKYLNPKVLAWGSNMNNEGISSIIDNLNDDLEQLDLSQNMLNGKSLANLTSWMNAKAFTGKLRLRSLNLSGNKLNDENVSIICKGLRSSNPYLKELDLSKD